MNINIQIKQKVNELSFSRGYSQTPLNGTQMLLQSDVNIDCFLNIESLIRNNFNSKDINLCHHNFLNFVIYIFFNKTNKIPQMQYKTMEFM